MPMEDAGVEYQTAPIRAPARIGWQQHRNDSVNSSGTPKPSIGSVLYGGAVVAMPSDQSFGSFVREGRVSGGQRIELLFGQDRCNGYPSVGEEIGVW
jgi:hypothetical protein